MKTAETVFVIPTHRLRDITETIETYDEHFWSNGHSVKMIVFDDSSLANHEKYFSRLDHTKTSFITLVLVKRNNFCPSSIKSSETGN